MKKIFFFLSLFFLCISLGRAQEEIIKHTVEKGETVFQLSRTYNVTPEEIYALNPSAVDIIKIGEVLSIPKSDVQSQSISSSSSTTSTTSNSNTITYAVVYGDTKYSLARRFGMTLEEFERQNPHTKNGLQAGHILKIENQLKESPSTYNVTIKKNHLVLKGQTLWGISKANDLTVEQLVNANSDILSEILQIGQELKIPEPYSVNNSNLNTYIVQRGDTKYGLSKKYELTIAELERENPQIVRMLMAGQTIQIPKDSTTVKNDVENDSTDNSEEEEKTEITSIEELAVEESEKSIETPTEEVEPVTTSPVDEAISEESTPETELEAGKTSRYDDYKIQDKETLYGLSKKAGMSISDFVTLNPQLSDGVQIGMVVKMPKSGPIQEQTITETKTNVKKSDQRYVDLSQSILVVKKNQILLFLPFSESQFDSEYKQSTSFNDVSDEFFRAHLEFYRGAKIAQDSARALGLDFNFKIIETETSKRNSKAAMLAKENSAETYDAIVLPFYENDVEEVATFTKDNNIPVLTAANISEEQGHKNIFNGVPSLNVKRNVMLDYMNSNDANIVVVCDVARKESKAYISEYAPNAKFIEVNKKGTFNSDDFVSQLDTSKLNYVILESEKNSVFLSTTNLLFSQLSNHSIQLALLDNSLIPNTDDVSKKRFVILQMLYPSLTPLVETSMSSNFNSSYIKIYNVEPSLNVKYGFDLTFDTLLRTSQSKSFEASAESDISEYTALKFDYNMNKMGSHDNIGIYIIQYNSDGTLKELK